MPDDSALTRRRFLTAGALLGCSAAALPLVTRVTLAAVPGDRRLVVIVLRGAMDGLDAVRPVGDPAFAGLRAPGLGGGDDPGHPLDGFFALHPALAPLLPMWRAGTFGVAHAVATPYRDKRSHFDGQDILEAGSGLDVPDTALADGWLNRLIQSLPGIGSETAYAIGLDQLKVISGAAPVRQWSPSARIDLDAQSRRLLDRLYEDDPLFHAASAQAFDLADRLGAGPDAGGAGPAGLAAFAADRLRGAARIAAFSINGWDSHRDQRAVISDRLETLAATLTTLEARLGPEIWGQTAVLAMTEFGRTVRENGTGGTDHGTGGALLVAGGAVRGGRVLGDWPGLSDPALYQGRDLMPTRDVRAYAGWAMRGLFGLDRSLVEGSIFPGLDMGADPGLLL